MDENILHEEGAAVPIRTLPHLVVEIRISPFSRRLRRLTEDALTKLHSEQQCLAVVCLRHNFEAFSCVPKKRRRLAYSDIPKKKIGGPTGGSGVLQEARAE